MSLFLWFHIFCSVVKFNITASSAVIVCLLLREQISILNVIINDIPNVEIAEIEVKTVRSNSTRLNEIRMVAFTTSVCDSQVGNELK